MKTHILVLLFSTFILFISCENIEKSANYKKNSQGAYGELLVVMDSAQYNTELGYELQKILQKPFPALPQAEAYFTLRHIKPSKFDGLLKQHATIIYVTTFDNKSRANKKIQSYFSPESIKMIEEDPELYIFNRKDEFAKDQLVVHLFGKNEKELINNLRINGQKIIDMIDQSERKRIHKEIYAGKEQKNLTSYTRKKYGYGLRIPFGYDLATENNQFLWYSQLGTDLFRNLLIANKPYTSEEDFSKEALVEWRNQIGKTYLFGSGERDTVSYMLTDEKYIPVSEEEINFNGNYAVEIRGLWKLKNNTRGGPFLGIAFVDEELGRIFYVEGFLYAPNKIKRHMMRELEAVLHTFKSSPDFKKEGS